MLSRQVVFLSHFTELVLCFTLLNVLICNIFPLTAASHNSVASFPSDSSNTQNPVTLKRTGVYPENQPVSAEHHLFFIHNQLIMIDLVTFPADSLSVPGL